MYLQQFHLDMHPYPKLFNVPSQSPNSAYRDMDADISTDADTDADTNIAQSHLGADGANLDGDGSSPLCTVQLAV